MANTNDNNKTPIGWQPLKRETEPEKVKQTPVPPARPMAPPARPTTPPARPTTPPARPTAPPTRPTTAPARPTAPPSTRSAPPLGKPATTPPAKPILPPKRQPTPPPARPSIPQTRPTTNSPSLTPDETSKDFKSWQPKSSQIPAEERIPKKPSAAPPPPVEEPLPPQNSSALSGDKIPPHPDVALLYATAPQQEAPEEPLPETFQTWKPKASQISPEDRVPKPGERVSAQSQKAWEKSVNTKAPRPPKGPGHRKHSAAVPIGSLFVFLALIGLITVVMFSVRATERLIDNSKEKERFENILLPVIMFDPVPFEDPNEIGELALLRTSIWSTVIQNNEKYSFNDGNMVTVPRSDVDVACAKLFGAQVTLNHQSFDDDNSIYSYNKETLTYFVPLDTSIRYTPKVEGVSKKGDILSLTVGYLAPDNQWMMSLKGETKDPIPSKYMIYDMEKVDGNYQLIGIKDPPGGAVPGIPQISQQQQPLQSVIPSEKVPSEGLEQPLPINPEDQTKQQQEDARKQSVADPEADPDSDSTTEEEVPDQAVDDETV